MRCRRRSATTTGCWRHSTRRGSADLPVSRAEIVDRAADVASRAGDLDRAAQLVADALDELDPARDAARAAILHERRGWCLLQRGRDDDALEAYEQAIRLVPATPATAARARVLAANADALERVDRPHHAVERASEAVAAAIEARSPGDEGHARHTLGVAMAQMGDLEGGFAELYRALELAVRGGDIADAVGIHRHFWRLVVAEGKAEEFLATTIEQAATARTTAMPVLAGVLDAIAAGYCHQLGRWAEADELLTNLDPQRLDGIVQLVVAALLDADRGDIQRAGDRLEIVRANTLGLHDGRLEGLLFRGLAERAWSRGHLGAVAEIVDEGMQRTTDKEMIAWMALVGMRVADGPGAAVDRWAKTLQQVDDYADRRQLGAAAELRSAVTTGEAELTRISGRSDPVAWSAAVDSWDRTGFPHPAAYCRWRHGEAVLAAGGERDAAAALFAAASSVAVGLGARPLAAAIEQAARRARLPVGAAADAAAPGRSTDSEFGITARELEVLELLARGLTNKQIAETLFISEKTARVHVSHLLTKLGRLHPRRGGRRRPPPQPARPQMSAG